MDDQLVKRLLDLNREFYARFARDFSDTRAAERANVEPIMPYLTNGVKVLDVGCGNGRIAGRLDREAFQLTYVGIDVTSELIEIAGGRRFDNLTAEFHRLDITTPGWTETLRPRAPFDLALILAVLHHLPGIELRCAVLRQLRTLLRPGGTLILSNWQFMHDERLRNKIVSWQQLGIDETGLETGDTLMDWKRGGTGYRYVHLLTEAEIQTLAGDSGFQVIRQFYADANLNLWSILRRD